MKIALQEKVKRLNASLKFKGVWKLFAVSPAACSTQNSSPRTNFARTVSASSDYTVPFYSPTASSELLWYGYLFKESRF